MRRLGYRVVDLVVEHLATLSRQPVGQTAGRSALEAALREPLPERGADPLAVLSELHGHLAGSTLHVNHPRFFAFIPSPGNFVSVMADTLAQGFNVFAGTWLAGSASAEIELITSEWLCGECGLPEGSGGLFVSGGSVANLTALGVARQRQLAGRLDDAVVYFSDQTHSSVDRALAVLGFGKSQMRRIPADEMLRLPLDPLRRAVAEDRRAGKKPFCVVANVGTTNTGAVDRLAELAAFCRAEDLWLHADGAYGAAAVLSPRARPLLAGLGDVDSLSLDPHKWLFQPFECGCVLLRDRHWLHDAYAVHPEYMKDTNRAAEEPNFCEYGIQLTRGARALKLWMSLKVFGAAAFREAITRGFELSDFAEAELRRQPGCRIVTPSQMAIVSFRYEKPGLSNEQNDALNEGLVKKIMADGYAMLTSTVLRGRTVLRLCTINPRTTGDDIRETIARLTRFAAE